MGQKQGGGVLMDIGWLAVFTELLNHKDMKKLYTVEVQTFMMMAKLWSIMMAMNTGKQ